MNIAPTLARDIYAEHINEKGEAVWPEKSEERSELARVLYGKQLIATFDYWFNHAIDLIENPQPKKSFHRKNEAYKRDRYFRDRLSTLSNEQKQTVRNLVREVAHGILFGMLVDIDQSSKTCFGTSPSLKTGLPRPKSRNWAKTNTRLL